MTMPLDFSTSSCIAFVQSPESLAGSPALPAKALGAEPFAYKWVAETRRLRLNFSRQTGRAYEERRRRSRFEASSSPLLPLLRFT